MVTPDLHFLPGECEHEKLRNLGKDSRAFCGRAQGLANEEITNVKLDSTALTTKFMREASERRVVGLVLVS